MDFQTQNVSHPSVRVVEPRDEGRVDLVGTLMAVGRGVNSPCLLGGGGGGRGAQSDPPLSAHQYSIKGEQGAAGEQGYSQSAL